MTRAVVFDLLYTLVHPRGTGRMAWLADALSLDVDALRSRWHAFEPELESGRAGGPDPELGWLRATAAELGVRLTEADLEKAATEWDRGRREALLDPPAATIAALTGLRERGLKLGVLSNTHALEMRAWPRSPLAGLVDAVAFSHEIGHLKPERAAYEHILDRLAVPAADAAYVGDGSNDELLGARDAGFGLVALAEQAAAEAAPITLARLRAQADVSVTSLLDVERALSA
ncbi:HAD hydrolase-like protein [Actinoplanes sp. Pm04-4]|uniref:HAD hydrolase-like protein n=1 Tax=Paractinoplanes pyxinae TaxID=2997416 RepID=A0ABT4AUM2_9ACTN|nr:HAD family hydrolase [Actinoplanes pyxinae]MCY1137038.1 HAD hydrolase-like protein [Actinoplanes pyxinae]